MSDVSARVKELQQRGVRIVACTFVDLAGVTRVKCVPIGRLDRAAAHGVGISDLSAIYAIDDHITTTSVYDSPSGDMRLRWSAAGMLEAEAQFRRIIGYRDLAKLVIAVERHALLAPHNHVRQEVAKPATV